MSSRARLNCSSSSCSERRPKRGPLECFDERLEALNFGLCTLDRIDLARPFEDERAQHFNIVGKVRFHEHAGSESTEESPVNRQFAALAGGVRHARGASPDLPEKRRVARR